jgi:hypothetical protein
VKRSKSCSPWTISAGPRNSLAFRSNTRSGKDSSRRCSGFCQLPQTSTSHLLAYAMLLVVHDSGKLHRSRETSKIHRKQDLRVFSLSRRLASLANPAFLAYLGTGSKFERIYRSTRYFSALTPMETSAKTLKRNGFENQSEWSKTCEFIVICIHIPQETRR